jgi:hypothetical protein
MTVVEAKRQAVALLQQYDGGPGVHLEDSLLTGTVHFIAFESGRQTPDVLAILQQIPGSRVPESTKSGHFETSMQNRRRAMEKNPALPWHYGKCSPGCPPECQGKTSKRAKSAIAGGAEGPPSIKKKRRGVLVNLVGTRILNIKVHPEKKTAIKKKSMVSDR